MAFEEHINQNGNILFWQPEEKFRVNSKQILGMDLDWTIIKPIRGKIHPIDENDWEFIVKDSAMSRIKNKIDEGYKFVIFTNQGGLLDADKNKSDKKMGLIGFKNRWVNIYKKFQEEHNIHSVYLIVSLYDDFNRKPCTGMWEFMEFQLNDNIKVQKDKSFYVGDMAGRKGDHSSSDLLFALNVGTQFQVPEVFYSDSTLLTNRASVLIKDVYKNDKIFNGGKYIEEFDKNISRSNKKIINDIKNILLNVNTNSNTNSNTNLNANNKQYLILFVGSPASGKTTYYKQNFSDINNLVYLSSDTFNGTPAKFNKEVEKELKNKNSVIIDNTNGTIKTREKYIKLCQSFNNKISENCCIIYIKFNTNKEICMHLNTLRTKINNTCVLQGFKDCNHNVPAVAIHSYWKRLEEPTMEKEKFDYLFEIEYEPKFNKKEGITQNMFELLL